MSTNETKAFVESGKAAVHAMRRAFADILVAAGADPVRPQEVSRRFGLDKTLSWRIARVIREEDAWEAVAHIPRRPSVRIFINKMAEHGVPQDKLDALLASVGDFERFIEVHSGDRETLEMMVGSGARRSAEKRMENFRKDGFQAASAVWGVRARVQFSASFVVPTATPGMLRTAMICGFGSLRRLRLNLPWTVAALMSWDEKGRTENVDRGPIPLHPEGLVGGVPLFPEFCSNPLPVLRPVPAPGGKCRFELVEGPVGNTAATSIVLGWTWLDAVPAHASTPGEMGEHGMRMSTPVEDAFKDVFIHRSLGFAKHVSASVYSDFPDGPRYPDPGGHAGTLPVPTDVTDLGEGPPDTTTPEFPRYSELIAFTADLLGFPVEELHGFRYRLRYPPLPSFVVMRHPLLERNAQP